LCYLLGNQLKVQVQKGSIEHQSQLNLYLTEFIFGVRVHPTEFPFKSLRVSDNKRFVSCEPSMMK